MVFLVKGNRRSGVMNTNISTQAASAIKQSQIKNEISFAVAQKALKAEKQQGEAAVDLVKQVAQLSSQLAAGHVDVQL